MDVKDHPFRLAKDCDGGRDSRKSTTATEATAVISGLGSELDASTPEEDRSITSGVGMRSMLVLVLSGSDAKATKAADHKGVIERNLVGTADSDPGNVSGKCLNLPTPNWKKAKIQSEDPMFKRKIGRTSKKKSRLRRHPTGL